MGLFGNNDRLNTARYNLEQYEKTKTAEFITSVCGIVAAHTLFILLFKRIVYHRCGNDEAEGTDCLVPVTSSEDI